jgi:hypothetical protein
MRSLHITLAFILVVLAAVALAPDTVLTPYADVARALLPKAIAGGALLLFLAILADRSKTGSTAGTAVETVELPATAPTVSQPDADVVNFLSILQENGRLVDFLMQDIAGYSDAQIGAAGRVLHTGCRAAVMEHFGIRPIREEDEGSRVTVPAQYAPDDYRLVGRITGEAPFTGTLIHHGWRAEWVKLPRLARASAERLPTIATAEVEVA